MGQHAACACGSVLFLCSNRERSMFCRIKIPFFCESSKMGQNEEEVGTWFEKDEVDQVEIRTTPQTVYLARHVVGSSHKENKEANSQIEIWRQAVRRANDVTQKEMKPQEVALLTCVCTLCGNIDGRIVGAHVYCDKRLAWDNGEWTAHDLTCSSPEGGKEDDEAT